MWNKNGQMQPVNAVTSLFRALHWTDALCMCIACAAVYACSYLSAQKGALEGWVWESFVCLKLSLVPVFSEVVTEVCLGHTSYCLLNILAATAVFLRWEVLCGWRRQGDLCPWAYSASSDGYGASRRPVCSTEVGNSLKCRNQIYLAWRGCSNRWAVMFAFNSGLQQ